MSFMFTEPESIITAETAKGAIEQQAIYTAYCALVTSLEQDHLLGMSIDEGAIELAMAGYTAASNAARELAQAWEQTL